MILIRIGCQGGPNRAWLVPKDRSRKDGEDGGVGLFRGGAVAALWWFKGGDGGIVKEERERVNIKVVNVYW